MPAKKQRKRGGVGEGIFAEVEKMTASGEMGPTEAFSRIAKRTGRKAGTVAANYYRIARLRGKPLRKRTKSAGRSGGASSARLSRVLKELESLVRAQEGELARLRRENARLAEIRRLVKS